FTESSPREHVVFRAVQKDDISIPFQSKMLKPVIKDNHIAGEQLMSCLNRVYPLASHYDRDIGEPLRDEIGFIAAGIRTGQRLCRRTISHHQIGRSVGPQVPAAYYRGF